MQLKQKLLTLGVAIICLLLVGPELGLGLELLGLLDLFGVELFLLCFAAPITFYWFRFQLWLGKIDPYFFVPSRQQVCEYPSIVAHAIPGYIGLILWFAGLTVIVS